MNLEIDNLSFNLIVDENRLNKNLTPVIFMHGFTGSASDWRFLYDKLPGGYLPVAIDLIGHGKTDAPTNTKHYSTASQIKQLKLIIAELNFTEVVLCGYSMGGRLALSFTLENPELIGRLILESSTPGIRNKVEQVERLKNDKMLADKIETGGIENFINYWMDIPLFDTLKKIPKDDYRLLVNSKLNNNCIGLSNSLKGFSAGIMPEKWNELKNISCPTLLITGEDDTKFTAINSEAGQHIPNARHSVIKGCGHNTHLEKPEEFIILVNQFLSR